ncbi:biopolymer transporter ExbD [Maricaulis sp.]|uniref:ExbD/TolR family protein n=1 Tax=Maricaulis sp. TaxID=1486257 RepID=UPI001B1595F5|nr:biopolymer transporter ExbD [Maricaulis sp.]MBO6798106.1 hypothetical protein [Maricaulis sp.]
MATVVLATYHSEAGVSLAPPPASDVTPECGELLELRVTEQGEFLVDEESFTEASALAERIASQTPEVCVLVLARDETPHGAVVQIWDELMVRAVRASLARE